MLLGGVDFKLIHQSHNPNVATVLLVAYVFSMCIVLLNCLIAIMSDSANKVLLAGPMSPALPNPQSWT